MGILDEAIREHLELKRRLGAEDSEIEGLESEAFGPADRPDAVEAEAPSISPEPDPGSEDERPEEPVGQAERGSTDTETVPPEAAAATEPEPTFAEHRLPDPPATETAGSAEPATETTSAPEPTSTAEPDAVAEVSPAAFEPVPEEGGDASDMLEAERRHMAEHPTEHYDVDAAIAEEDEIDVLSESSLSDELDRALDGPLDSPAPGESPAAVSEPEEAATPPFPEPGPPEPVPDPVPPAPGPDPVPPGPGPEPNPEPGPPPEPIPEPVIEEPAPEPAAELLPDEAAEEDEEGDIEEEDDTAAFFDQEDPLEGTPDFLEETPEHDRLWFEQDEPKDFDFGD